MFMWPTQGSVIEVEGCTVSVFVCLFVCLF